MTRADDFERRALGAIQTLKARIAELESRASEPLAVIGMACRLPQGANDIDALWSALCDGSDGVGEIPESRWDIDAWHDPNPEVVGKMYTKRGGFIDDVEGFDAEFFGISPREARSLDPQQRLLLEVGWEALESAGVPPDGLRGSDSGVFLGITTQDFGELLRESTASDAADPYALSGSLLNMAAGRISHFLGLRGPSLTLDTACSSSLVALHVAAQSLRHGEADLALAGGVNLMLTPGPTVIACATHLLARDGRCKTFDARADGYVRAEGCGIVVLKRLSDAQRDRNPIFALLRGTAVNHDGASSGLTVPNAQAQAAVIELALSRSGLSPRDIDYVEVHGTGTALGDPIELQGLERGLLRKRDGEPPLILGALKSQYGHLEAAAGIAGFIKTVLQLDRGRIAPVLHLEHVNPALAVRPEAIEIPRDTRSWPERGRPRRAGVSAFGVSGTNAHVIVEQAPEPWVSVPPERGAELVCLSARSPAALHAVAERFAVKLRSSDASSLYEIACTAARARTHHRERLAIVANDVADLTTRIEAFAAGDVGDLARGRVPPTPRSRIAFVFSGQGGLWAGVPETIWLDEAFRSAFDAAEDAYVRQRPRAAAAPLRQALCAKGDASRLRHTEIAQPALLALQFGLCAWWRARGIEPSAVVGHSVGEAAAACMAGALTLDDAMRVVVERSRLMAPTHGTGRMLAVPWSEAHARAVAADAPCVDVAAVNAHESCVLAGTEESLASYAEQESRSRWLDVDYAFHSGQMDHAVAPLEAALAGLRPSTVSIPMISTVTGMACLGTDLDARYWGRHLRSEVRFRDAIELLVAEGTHAYLEIGAHPVLGADLESLLASDPPSDAVVIASSLRRGRDPHLTLLRELGRLHVRGVPVDWQSVFPTNTRPVPLPLYPWQRERFVLRNRSRPSAPMQRIGWETLEDLRIPPSKEVDARGRWIVVGGSGELAARLGERLQNHGAECAIVPSSGPVGLGTSLGAPGAKDIRRFIAELPSEPGAPGIRLVYLDGEARGSTAERAERECIALLAWLQALIATSVSASPRVFVITRGADSPDREERRCEFAALRGMARVVVQEHPELHCTRIDLDPVASVADQLDALWAELMSPNDEDEIAHRHGRRHAPRLEPMIAQDPPLPIRAKGTTLITGGFGALGLRTAEWLVDHGARSLVLMGRRGAPPEAASALAALESRGVRVRCVASDVSDRASVGKLIEDLGSELRCVVHAAGTLQDGLIPNLDARAFAAVFAPKVRGAWNLHEATRSLGIELDAFILFSSAASLLGAPAQANYAAANAFLDSLAHHRHALGLPALSLNWGPWGGLGMAAELEFRAVDTLRPAQAFSAFERALGASHPQVGVLHFSAARWLEAHPTAADTSLLRRIVGDRATLPRGELRKELDGCGDHESRLGRLESALIVDVAQLLELEPDRCGPEQPFQEMGFDSLIAVELRNRIERRLDLRISTAELFAYPDIAKLSSALLERLKPATADPVSDPDAGELGALAASEVLSQLEAELSALSEVVEADDAAA